jgi:hypothetical protein
MKGFSEKWCQWINQIITKGSVGIKINDNVSRYFQTKKGLRQGDPLSPLLFNLIADMLNLLISRAKEEAQLTGLVPHLVDRGLSILQYADNTNLFMDHNIEKAINLKLLLCAFEQLLGLKINFHRWAKNMNGAYKKEKKDLIEKIEQLNKKAEMTMLLQHEVDMKHSLRKRFVQLLREVEIKWYQRSKSDKLLMGDKNTKYIHLLANGKDR